jgi:N-acetylmuramoyl-L-alanine amidase
MNRTLTGTLLLVALLSSSSAGAQGQSAQVETLYADAKAKEKAVRSALADPAATSAVLKAVRTVVADYETLVRNFPASAYSDDALWFGGWLAIDSYERFGDEQERATGTRLWRALTVQYPSSKLARQVPQQLERLGFLRRTAAPAPPVPAVGQEKPAETVAAPRPQPLASRPAAAPPRSRSALATLKDIRRTILPDVVRIVLELDQEVVFRDERLDGPARVFVDLPSTTTVPELRDRTIRFDGDADMVHQIRIGRHPNNTTRVVLDISGVSSYSVYPLYGPYRLVIDCLRQVSAMSLPGLGKPAPPAPLVSRPLARAVALPRVVDLPRVTALPSRALASTRNIGAPAAPPTLPAVSLLLRSRMTAPMYTRGIPAAPASLAPKAPAEPPSLAAQGGPLISPPARNVGGGFSIARQLGLTVSRIVIDPGHGGHDPGATGKGLTEAAVVLDVGLRLEKLLTEVEGLEVILTRRTDDFVPLQERTAIANREGADLFLSIHANASSSLQVNGIETYFLNFATSSTAAAVAARENASSGQTMAALPDVVKAIALHNKLDESRDFATFVQSAMVEGLREANRGLRDLGVKQAPFVVLVGAAMPSVLAEVAFLSNAQEVRLLRGTAYRQRIAQALFEGIRRYQGSLKAESEVAQQQ